MSLWPLQSLSERSFCIYGAGIVAASAYTAIEALYGRVPLFFLVSDSEANGTEENNKQNALDAASNMNGIPIKKLSEWKEQLHRQNGFSDFDFKNSLPEQYLVATPEAHHLAIVEALHALQIEESRIFLLTNERENELMEAYYRGILGHNTVLAVLSRLHAGAHGHSAVGRKQNSSGTDLDSISTKEERSEALNASTAYEQPFLTSAVHVYQAKSHMDRPLLHHFTLPSYIRPIQVGADLTEQTIASLQDNSGENISAKNRNYCELTATYYAWKHSHASYKGICHYRRIFNIGDEQMQRLLQCEAEWDVILPYPTIHYPNLSLQHTRYVKEEDWNAMLQAVRELEPGYLEAYEKSVLCEERGFYNFNMLIAKAAVFDDYCHFLFRILERTEELVTPRGWERADRFAGYLGENLTTIYFLKNREKWKILYAGKAWLT